MANAPTTSGLHHIALTITDLQRSIDFYTTHVGFQLIVEFEPDRALLSNGAILLTLGQPYDPAQVVAGDTFNENRTGLDHISFGVENHRVLEEAAAYFDAQGVERGEIRDLGAAFAVYVMAVRDPDNIQLELTAPYPA